jgi:hypothetical protein
MTAGPCTAVCPDRPGPARRGPVASGLMGAEATLNPGRLPVAPADQAATEIVVKNTGLVVDSFTLSVLGPVAAWAFCEPEVLRLFPGQEAAAHVVLQPPLAPGLYGPVAFGVRVASSEDPPGSVVEEGVLDIAPMSLVAADLSPRTGRARGMGASRHRVAVDNRGNAPAIVPLVGGDDADTAQVVVKPPELEVPPGSAAFADVRVSGRRRFWRGTPVTHRFQVTAHPPEGDPLTTEGTLMQEAVVPSWLPRAVAVAAVAAVAAAALWFGVLRPTVRDAATSAGTAAAQKVVNAALEQGTSPASGGATAGSAGPRSPASSGGKATPNASATPKATPKPGSSATPRSSATPTTSPKPASGSTATPARPAPAPFALTLDTTSKPALTVAAGHTVALTDLVMMNPAGDQGMLTLSRSGQVLFSLQLADFREYDLHFITAIMIDAGQNFSLSVACQNSGGKKCTPTVMVSGTNAG